MKQRSTNIIIPAMLTMALIVFVVIFLASVYRLVQPRQPEEAKTVTPALVRLDDSLKSIIKSDFPPGTEVVRKSDITKWTGLSNCSIINGKEDKDTLYVRTVKLTSTLKGEKAQAQTDYVIVQYQWSDADKPDYMEIMKPATDTTGSY